VKVSNEPFRISALNAGWAWRMGARSPGVFNALDVTWAGDGRGHDRMRRSSVRCVCSKTFIAW
jgi:hypothetical protein